MSFARSVAVGLTVSLVRALIVAPLWMLLRLVLGPVLAAVVLLLGGLFLAWYILPLVSL